MNIDKEIDDAAEKWWYKPLRDTMNSDGTFDRDMFRYKDLGKQEGIRSFTAGAKWMQEKNAKEIELLKTKIEQERSHIRTCHIAMEGHHKEIEQLKQRLEIAVEALLRTKHIIEVDFVDEVLRKISAEKGEINEKI